MISHPENWATEGAGFRVIGSKSSSGEGFQSSGTGRQIREWVLTVGKQHCWYFTFILLLPQGHIIAAVFRVWRSWLECLWWRVYTCNQAANSVFCFTPGSLLSISLWHLIIELKVLWGNPILMQNYYESYRICQTNMALPYFGILRNTWSSIDHTLQLRQQRGIRILYETLGIWCESFTCCYQLHREATFWRNTCLSTYAGLKVFKNGL